MGRNLVMEGEGEGEGEGERRWKVRAVIFSLNIAINAECVTVPVIQPNAIIIVILRLTFYNISASHLCYIQEILVKVTRVL